jgi:two-component system sensor histidine kinase/response regulator
MKSEERAASELSEEELRRVYAEQQLILDRSVVGFALLRDRKIIRCNRRYEEIFGYRPGELVGKSTRLLFPSDETYQREGVAPYEVIARGEVYSNEASLVRRNGELFWGRVTGTAIDPAAPRRGSIWNLEDVTHRRETEQALARAYAEQKLIFDRSVVGISFIRNRVFLRCNRRMEEMFGYGPGEMHGQSTRIYFASQEDYEAMGVRVLAEMHRGDAVIIEGIYRRKNGELFWARLNGTAIDAADPLSGSIWVFEDINDRKKAELELQSANERIERMNAELEERVRQRTAELEALVKELETIHYAVAHDLRTSLGVMSVNAGMLQSDLGARVADDDRRALGRIASNAELTVSLLDNLLEYARLGRELLRRGPVAMSQLMHAAWREFARTEPERQVFLEAGQLPDCVGDERMLAQLWTKLLSNALKYTRARDEARIAVGYSAAQSAYFVRDNGVGFDMRYADKMFDLFERLHRDEGVEGTGIGLALAARIVRRHGGRIWAESRPGEGATFWFSVCAD